jgi:23S rRNA (cytosine1962-C5)-methyltransferase
MSDVVIPAELPALRLKRNEDRRLNAGHLWIFSNEVDTQQTALHKFKPGDCVRVLAHNDKALGLAFVNPQSLICARLLSTWSIPDAAWLAARIRIALKLRESLYAKPYYRLIFGESDGLPGLIVDRYGATCVVQIGTAGMERLKDQIQRALIDTVRCEAVLFKNDSASRELEGLPGYVETGYGHIGDLVCVEEDGLKFKVPLASGQKTGWFFDQAANRRSLPQYMARGARVLDVFSYVGAWGVRALHAGAHEVLCVDSSAAALELAAVNAAVNAAGNEPGNGADGRGAHAGRLGNGRRGTLNTLKGDAFDVLEELAAKGERFDVVVIDPPAFAKRKKDHPKALAAYKRLNQLAMQLIGEGILVSCSCSFHVSAEDLQDAIGKAARSAQKHVQILSMGGQAADHPVHPAIPETRYLKAYFCRVSDGLK